MNTVDMIVVGVIGLCLFLALRAIGRRRAHGGGCCGSCSGCAMAGSCGGAAGAEKKPGAAGSCSGCAMAGSCSGAAGAEKVSCTAKEEGTSEPSLPQIP